ncbi:hypothetical protein Trco_003539 [Trichoderma cornu-damae]|uniref:Palmitoyltransferase n=1 Tax=Trichoderma cornu-damae TaxID=654480 RepID=A0A9P8QIW6_9HYPO|nr:hypothetical protein Trco_003539 [Trichoderma cornu-damae]
MPRPHHSSRSSTRWAVRIIPLFIASILAVATANHPQNVLATVGYLYRKKGQAGVVTAFLVLYFFFFLLMAASYLRTFFTVQLNPGVVPLAPQLQAQRDAAEKLRKRHKRNRDVEDRALAPPDPNPDSPGLEAFYSKDVFVCEVDGRPKWCSECQQWKPDRSHHSSDLGRCVRKMDHFCPWVGGMVSETSFNFFTQFCFYCSLFCAVSLAAGAYSFQQHHSDGDPPDGWALATIILAILFGTFTFGMTLTSFRYILANTTTVDMLKRPHTFVLAVRIPQSTPPSDKYTVIVYPLRGLPWRPGSEGQHHICPLHGPVHGPVHGPASARDQLAERKFAILRTKPRENPWDLGAVQNWKSVMGDNFLEWVLPIRHSPCCNHDSMESDYRFGPLVSRLRKRFGVPELEEPPRGGHAIIEMHDRGSRRAND